MLRPKRSIQYLLVVLLAASLSAVGAYPLLLGLSVSAAPVEKSSPASSCCCGTAELCGGMACCGATPCGESPQPGSNPSSVHPLSLQLAILQTACLDGNSSLIKFGAAVSSGRHGSALPITLQTAQVRIQV